MAVLDAEQDAAEANITTFGDALWWACTTVTTVGYGDFFPVTFEGRVCGCRPDGRRDWAGGHGDRLRGQLAAGPHRN